MGVSYAGAGLDDSASDSLLSYGTTIGQPFQGYAGDQVPTPGSTLSPHSNAGNPTLKRGYDLQIGGKTIAARTIAIVAIVGLIGYLIWKR